MNEREVMNLLNSIDNDLVDQKIDELMNEKGESVNVDSIKEKAMQKLNQRQVKKNRFNKKIVIAAAVAATLTVSTVYAGEISKALQSFFNKSVVYSTVVDGDAYYLPEEVKLNEKFTLVNVNVSKGKLDMTVKVNQKMSDEETENLNVAAIPMNNESIRYAVGGYGYDENGNMTFGFMNETENNYNIAPFKDFTFFIGGGSYDVSLTKAESLKVDENLVVGNPEKIDNGNDGKEAPDKEAETNEAQNTQLIANVAGSMKVKDGVTNIQLVAGFDDADLKLKAFGAPDFTEFNHMFENREDGIIGSGTSSMTKPIMAYDKDNNPYALEVPQNAVGRPITVFETNAEQGADLTVKLPAILVGYEKEVASLKLTIPEDGEAAVQQELDFLIQKVNVKSIQRISEDTAVVVFDLNVGEDKTVSIVDIGAYSKDVIKADTVIKGNTATMTMTFDKNLEEADFTFSWPNYVVQGNWSIELGEVR